MTKLYIVLTIMMKAAKRFYHDNYGSHASALAYETLLSLVPIFSVMFYCMSFFPTFSDYLLLAQNYIYSNFIPSSSVLIRQYVDQFIFKTNQLPLTSILLFAITGLMIIFTMGTVFNDIWRTKSIKKDIFTIVVSSIILFIMPLILGFSVFITGYFASISMLSGISAYIIMVMDLLINACMLSIIYIVVPNKRVKWRDGFTAGIIAAVFFNIIKTLFVLYLTYFAQYELIYGAFAIIPIFLIWIYISWSIVLYAGLLVQAKIDLKTK